MLRQYISTDLIVIIAIAMVKAHTKQTKQTIAIALEVCAGTRTDHIVK